MSVITDKTYKEKNKKKKATGYGNVTRIATPSSSIFLFACFFYTLSQFHDQLYPAYSSRKQKLFSGAENQHNIPRHQIEMKWASISFNGKIEKENQSKLIIVRRCARLKSVRALERERESRENISRRRQERWRRVLLLMNHQRVCL